MPYLPTPKLDQATSIWNAFGNVSGMFLEDANLSVGEIILIQIGDVLKELQSSFCSPGKFERGKTVKLDLPSYNSKVGSA